MPDMMTAAPVFSALDTAEVCPEGSPRTYTLAVPSFRQRQAFLRDVRRRGGRAPDRTVMLGVLREAMRALAPANLGEVLAQIDEAEAAPADRPAQARLALIEHAGRNVPAYDDLCEANQTYQEEYVWLSAAHFLAGWSGPGLPPFERAADRVPDHLLDHIPAAEFRAISDHAYNLMWLGKSAVGNSAPPSPSPETQETSTAD